MAGKRRAMCDVYCQVALVLCLSLAVGCSWERSAKPETGLLSIGKVDWEYSTKDYQPVRIHAFFFNASEDTALEFQAAVESRKEYIAAYRTAAVSDPTEELRQSAKLMLDQYEKDLHEYAGHDPEGTRIMVGTNFLHPETRTVFVAILDELGLDVALTMRSKAKSGEVPGRVIVKTGQQILSQIRKELRVNETSFEIEKGNLLLHEGLAEAMEDMPSPAQH